MKMETDRESLCHLAMENIDLLLECGYNKPACRLQISDKTDVMQTISLHKVILGCLGELCSLKEGLKSLGVLDVLMEDSFLLRDFFCIDTQRPITSGYYALRVQFFILLNLFNTDEIVKLFTFIKYSDKGCNERERQEQAYIYFVDYLEEVEKS